MAGAEDALTGSTRQLLAVAENYPQLKASELFLNLQEQLTTTEDKVEFSRRFYNGNVRDFNTALQTFPTNIYGRIMAFPAVRLLPGCGRRTRRADGVVHAHRHPWFRRLRPHRRRLPQRRPPDAAGRGTPCRAYARAAMKGYHPMDSFDKASADVYDQELRGDEQATVALLAELARGGPALELAIGTGRIALPLAAKGIRVDGIDMSDAMVAQLRTKPGGDSMSVAMGDFADVGVEGTYRLIYLVFNTLFNLLEQEDQVRCFVNAAKHMTDDGCFVVEGFVPAISTASAMTSTSMRRSSRSAASPSTSGATIRSASDSTRVTWCCLQRACSSFRSCAATPGRAKLEPDGTNCRAPVAGSVGRVGTGAISPLQAGTASRSTDADQVAAGVAGLR